MKFCLSLFRRAEVILMIFFNFEGFFLVKTDSFVDFNSFHQLSLNY
jgi:hypothetical protein